MILAVMGEIPSIFLAFMIIDLKGFGRKNSLVYSFLIIAIANFTIYYSKLSNLGIILFVSRFFMKNGYSMLIPFTCEIYPTLLRTLGYGYAAAFGKFGAFVSAFVVFPLFYINTFLPFIAISILCLLASITVAFIPFDTRNKWLDQQVIL